MTVKRTCICCFSLLIALISAVIIVITIYIHLDFERIMENRVKSEMIINRENAFYDYWLHSRVTERTNFYIFEVENPKEILKGMKPKVKEIGPFVFRIERVKERVSYSFDKSLVSYSERKVYHFEEMLSTASLDHNITVINLQMMVLNPMMSELAKNSNAISGQSNNTVISSIFETFGSNIIVSKPVGEILFGSKSASPVDRISQYLPQLSRLGITIPKQLSKDYALFPNNSQNKFEVFTGYKTGLFGRILKWNDKTALDVWTGRSCNQINGTNGLQYSPLTDKSDRLYDYSTEMCRSIEMSYEDFYEVEGIPVYRFSPVDNIFFSLHYNKKNKCFCLSPEKPEKCNFIGILDLFSCSSGAPLILSNPHFRRSSEVIGKSVVGLSPEERLHQSYTEIEPITGLVLHKVRRYQYNVHVKKAPINIDMRQNLKEAIIPLVWFEELSEMEDNSKEMVRLLFVYPFRFEDLIALALLAFSVMLLLMSLCCCCCCGKDKKIEPISNQESKASGHPINAMNGQISDNTISHTYDQIFKGQTPLNRLKDNPLKRPHTVRNHLAPQPPPPPPPPPQPLVASQQLKINKISPNINSPQNLFNEIQGINLKKVNDNDKNSIQLPIMKADVNKDKHNDNSRPIMTSLTKELEERMRRKSLDQSAKGIQSYYRWNNTNNNINNRENSILDQRTKFKEPPIPCKTVNNAKEEEEEESIDPLDSDFSDEEDREGSDSADRNRLMTYEKNRLNNNISINAIISDDIYPNHNRRKISSHSIVTDIYQFVN